MPAPKLIVTVDEVYNNQCVTYELGDASLMTDLMRGIMPEIRYNVKVPTSGFLTFTFKVEQEEAQEVTPQPTLDEYDDSFAAHCEGYGMPRDEADQSEADHIHGQTDDDEYDEED